MRLIYDPIEVAIKYNVHTLAQTSSHTVIIDFLYSWYTNLFGPVCSWYTPVEAEAKFHVWSSKYKYPIMIISERLNY